MSELERNRATVLVVDDEEAMREVLVQRLAAWGWAVATADSAEEARSKIEQLEPCAVVSDVMLGDGSGLDVLRSARSRRPDCEVILITAHGTVDLAVAGMKGGALDFLTKPLDYERLRSLLAEIVDSKTTGKSAAAATSEGVPATQERPRLLGSSSAMVAVRRLLEEVAATDVAIFLSGESGTGKEIAARSLHAGSLRAAGPFVAINCAAMPAELIESELFGHEKGAFTGATKARPGCFELADGGTLMLDEIAEMPPDLQAKLLRVLEDGHVRRLGGNKEKRVDVRVVSATNRSPQEAIESGRLREDLFYRLNVVEVEMPPLRCRREDIGELAEHFLTQYNARHCAAVEGFDDEARKLLETYHWPGNVRELRNVVERGVVLAKSGRIGVEELPLFLRRPDPQAVGGEVIELPLGASVAEAEKILILRTLELTGHNKAEAARRLGVDPKTVRNKLKAYGISE